MLSYNVNKKNVKKMGNLYCYLPESFHVRGGTFAGASSSCFPDLRLLRTRRQK